jgi:hypothetical protein
MRSSRILQGAFGTIKYLKDWPVDLERIPDGYAEIIFISEEH